MKSIQIFGDEIDSSLHVILINGRERRLVWEVEILENRFSRNLCRVATGDYRVHSRTDIVGRKVFEILFLNWGDCIRITRKQDTYGRSDRGRERKRKETVAQADKDNKEDDKHDDDK